jgi:hypothetical protein
MRVSDVRVVPLDDWCELQARVESDADPRGPGWFAPWVLWYRFPAWCEPFLSPENGDPFLAALLPAAMASDQPLTVPAPISPALRRATPELQSIYRCFDPQFSRVEIAAPVRDHPACLDPAPPATGVFFSLGVDSFYSLLKNGRDHPDDDESVTHLIIVHGFDAIYGTWKTPFPSAILENADRVASQLGKTLLPVITNARTPYPVGTWNLAHGAGLVSVVLALGDFFRRVFIAASTTYDNLYPWGSHPVLDPLWSTERLRIVHDGCELGRIDKTHYIACAPVVLDTLRVCPGYEPRYNCGRCAKCMATMIDLLLIGALDRCSTLPHHVDAELLRRVMEGYDRLLSSWGVAGSDTKDYVQRCAALEASAAHAELRTALAEHIARDNKQD